MSAHTPAPWIVRDGLVCSSDIYASAIPLAGAWIDGSWQGNDATPESIANAYLCAAAPELLAACKEAIAELDDCCAVPSDDWDFYEKLRRAIAKAEGR
jgi:hypothetical protein